MKLTDLSDISYVRKLCPEDVESICAPCKASKAYYKYFKTAPTHKNVMEDLSRTPPGKATDDKHSLDFFQKDQTPIAILDLISDCPEPQVAYIGLFMLGVSEQGKGIDSNIMKRVLKQLTDQGITCVRPGCIHGNVGAAPLWKRNGFYSFKKQLQAVDDQVDLMEKAS